MPIVPRISERSIEPQGIPNARLNPSLPSAAFGGMEQTQSTAINIAEKHYEKEKRKLDQAVLLDADLKLSDLSTRLDIEASKYKGRDAQLGIDHIETEWPKAVRDIESTLANDEQKLAFRNREVNHWTNLNERINRHAATETDKYVIDTNKAAILSRIDTTKRYYDDPAAIDYTLTELNAIIKDFYKGQGLDETQAAVEFEKVKKLVNQSAKDGFNEYLLAALDANDVSTITQIYGALKATDKESGKHINYAILEPKEREAAIKDVEAWNTLNEKRIKDAKKEQQEAVHTKLVYDLLAGKLTKSAIMRSGLDGDKMHQLDEWRRSAIDDAKKDKKVETDSNTKARLLSAIWVNPGSVKREDILREMQAGRLTPNDAENLLKDREGRINSGMSDPASDAVFKNLQADQKEGVFGEGQEGGLNHTKQIEQYLNWRAKNPDAKPSDWYEHNVEPVKKNWFYRLWDNVTGGTDKTHSLSGRPAGKYKVDGRIINWDGTKELP